MTRPIHFLYTEDKNSELLYVLHLDILTNLEYNTFWSPVFWENKCIGINSFQSKFK